MSEATTPRQQMADALRAEIRGGRYAPGEQLPSQRQLAAQYGVAQNTAGEAVKVLQLEGLLDTPTKARPRVRAQRALLRLGAERYSNHLRERTGLSPFRAEVAKQGKTARVDCTSITKVSIPADIAERMDVDGDVKVVRRENWYFSDDEPVQMGVTYIPWETVKGTPLADSAKMGKGSLYARLEECGHRITSIREEVSSRMPTPDEVKSLEVPIGTPVLEVVHTSFDQDGVAFEVTRFVMRADTNGLDYRIHIED